MNSSASRNPLPVLAAMIAAAVGLYLAPGNITAPIKSAVRDSAYPGHRAVELSIESVRTVAARMPGTAEDVLDAESPNEPSPETALELRRLQIENARLHQQIRSAKRTGVSPYRNNPAEPLLLDELITAEVFGKETATLWRAGVFINMGRNENLRESDLILQSDAPLVDAGTDSALETGYPVFAGRCVYGRISNVGRWTSTVEHVADRKFRGHAQIVTNSGQGYHFGAQGVLEGTGDDLCRLTLIPASAPVAVGDGVYTNSEQGTFPFPMYYGRITRAELKPGESHWQIEVQPAAAATPPGKVQILRKRLNPKRESRKAGKPEMTNDQ